MSVQEILTLVIAVAAVAGAFGTIYYAAVSRRSYIAQRQVFVVVPTMGMEVDAAKGQMHFIIVFGAFGGSTATNVQAKYDVYMSGVSQATARLPDKPQLAVPGVLHRMDGYTSSQDFSRIRDGSMPLEITVEILYDDFQAKHHRYYAKARYEPKDNSFMKLEETLT